MRYWIGKLLCKCGWHDWYEGVMWAYCRREGCRAKYNLIIDDEDNDYDG
jgi:hypothetical protein